MKFEESLKLYDEAIKLDPKYFYAYNSKGSKFLLFFLNRNRTLKIIKILISNWDVWSSNKYLT